MNLRDDVQTYMSDLRAWLKSQEDAPLEAMSDFFTARLDSYEAHMAHWREDYRRFASLFPENARDVLDLGCGTGLELNELLLLLRDEPSMGRSPLLVKEIFKIIRQVNRNGVTVLLVEQNAKMALEIANRAYVLETGKIKMEGEAHELANNIEVRKAYLGCE